MQTRNKPRIADSKLDLPAPTRPTTAISCPLCTAKLRSRNEFRVMSAVMSHENVAFRASITSLLFAVNNFHLQSENDRETYYRRTSIDCIGR